MNEEAVYDARLELVDFAIEVFWDTPSEEFVVRLLDDEPVLPAESINDPLDEGFDVLRGWLEQNRGRPVEVVCDELSREYTELFVGPRPPVLPHESYYREDTQYLGDGLARVEESYRAAGWLPPEEYPEESDFIAVELAFLRNLIERQRAGQEETVGFERVFIEDHLTQWIDVFVEELRQEAEPGLYLAAALVVQGLVEFEEEIVVQLA
ncbi:molecular chaperone [Natribaculum luteum]|uniref:Molecular chaperone n=1 Tax=Natribaculum luteum TaxID=1586232 RepID=A0ABD5NZ05_9EURY|nr:molecular chaperone TorD family protein [Natribaculum luteum]